MATESVINKPVSGSPTTLRASRDRFGHRVRLDVSAIRGFTIVNDDPVYWSNKQHDLTAEDELTLDGLFVVALCEGEHHLISRGFVGSANFNCHDIEAALVSVERRDMLPELIATMVDSNSRGSRNNQVPLAMRHLGYEFETKLFSRGWISRAIELGFRGCYGLGARSQYDRFSVYRGTQMIFRELKALDKLNSNWRTWRTGILGAAISSQILWPDEIELWQRVVNRRGNMVDGSADPVQAIVQQLESNIDEEPNDEVTMALYSKAMSAAQGWHKSVETGEPVYYRKRLRSILTDGIVDNVRTVLGVKNDPQL